MKSLQVLVCGGDSQALQKVAQRLSDEGVKAQTSTQVTDQLCRTDQEWDLLLVDLDAMTSLLRGLLPAVRRKFPHLSMLGIVNGSPLDIGYLSYDLELDGYMFGPPRPEEEPGCESETQRPAPFAGSIPRQQQRRGHRDREGVAEPGSRRSEHPLCRPPGH